MIDRITPSWMQQETKELIFLSIIDELQEIEKRAENLSPYSEAQSKIRELWINLAKYTIGF